MNIRWDYLLIPSFVVSFVLLASSQLTFLRGSLSTDLGLGILSPTIGTGNYETLFTANCLLPGSARSFDDQRRSTLDHELEITYFHIAVKRFCEQHELTFYWQQSDLKRGIHPDVYFSITNPRLPEGKNTLHYFLEIEKGKAKFCKATLFE